MPTAVAAIVVGRETEVGHGVAGSERAGGADDDLAVVADDAPYSWLHYDKIVTGFYSFDAKSGTITIKGGPEASYDMATGVLTWQKQKYALVKDGKSP